MAQKTEQVPAATPAHQPSGLRGDLLVLIGLAAARLVFHLFTNGAYGWHRDELATLDDARHLAWGYVAYPPLTPAIARFAMELFGPSLVGVRLFAGLAMAAAMVLTGLMARELGGGRWAQVVAALAVAVAPISMLMGAVFQYVAFDYLWWVLTAYFAIRLCKTDNPRWWLAIGATLGMGAMTKYTVAFLIAGIVVGVLLSARWRDLLSAWLWAGVGLTVLIFLPNFIWQLQHGFVAVDFTNSIHARDVRIGRTADFLPEQLYVVASPLTLPLWLAGLAFYFFLPAGRRYRMIGWMFVISMALFWVAQGRGYYTSAAYPMLLAAGAVVWEGWLAERGKGAARAGRVATWAALGVSLVIAVVLMTPIGAVNSPLWAIKNEVHDNFREQIGWTDLTDTVAEIYFALPEEAHATTGILTGNYGEAGAINLYGPERGLPRAISGVNSLWLRGYGDPPPTQVIVLGYGRADAEQFFNACEVVGRVTNRYGVENEETARPEILLCRRPRAPWEELWPRMQRFG